MPREPRPRVVELKDQPMLAVPGTNFAFRVPIDRARAGCRNLIQRVFQYNPGTSPEFQNETSEDVIYVVSGSGQARVGGDALPLTPGTGLLVAPGVSYAFHNPGPEIMEIVSVLSPQPGYEAALPPSLQAGPLGGHAAATHESREEPLAAGEARTFKLLIDPRYGCRYVTQFVGCIEQSRAPAHKHTCEEVIYILDGEGVAYIGGQHQTIYAGCSLYLPPGTPHCLENPNPRALRLLGVFCPAGSPADKAETPD